MEQLQQQLQEKDAEIQRKSAELHEKTKPEIQELTQEEHGKPMLRFEKELLIDPFHRCFILYVCSVSTYSFRSDNSWLTY